MKKNNQLLLDFISSCKNISYVTSDSSSMYKIPEILGDDYCVINLHNDNSPLKPFMELLRFYNPPFKLLESEVYPPQLETFATYIHNGLASEREDIVLEQEIQYEKKRIKRALISLFEKINITSNYVFLNSQFLSQDSIEIITELEKSDIKGKFVFCFDINSRDFTRKSINAFIKQCCKKQNILNKFKLESSSGADLEEMSPEDSFSSCVNSLRNSRLFFDLKNARRIAGEVFVKMPFLSLTKSMERELALEIALAFYVSGDYDKAAMLLGNVADEFIDDEFDIRAKIYLSKLYIQKSMIPLAKKYALLVRQSLSSDKKSPYYAYAVMLDYLSTSRGEKGLADGKYFEAIELLDRLDLKNNYLNCATMFPSSVFDDKKNIRIFANILEKCERIASELDNEQQIATVLHWKSLYAQKTGNNDEARRALEKADAIRDELGDLIQMIQIKNGLSDFQIRMAHYKEAFNLLNEFLPKTYKITDYILIIQFLKNMSLAAFYFHDFETAEKLANVLLEFHNLFVNEKNSLNPFIPKINDMLCCQAVIDIYNHDYFHADLTYSILTSTDSKLSENCKPYIPFIKACLLAKEGDFDSAGKSFEKAVKMYEKFENYSHVIVFFYYEFAQLLDILSQKELSDQYFQKGFLLAREKALVFFYKNKKEYTLEDYRKNFQPMTPVKIDLNMLIDKASKDYSINQLHSKLSDYQFLTKINSLNIGIMGFQTYLEKISQIICEYLPAQSVSFAELGISKQWKNITSFAQNSTKEKSLPENVWSNFFDLYGNQGRLELAFDRDSELYYCNISKFDFTGAVIVLPFENEKPAAESLSIVNLALANIQSQLIIFRQHENLASLSATDPITSLSNRRALLRHLTLESERIERFNKRKGIVIQKAIAFIDIDNFKYYNERFGHVAGDFLLRSFAEVLKKTLRRIDFICRYGSDEFIVVMSDTSMEEGERMCQRIYIELSKQEFFLPALKKFLNQNFDIPPDREIGFSMGLCCNSDIRDPENLTEVLRNADRALRYTKEHGKGSVAIWEKIKDKL